MVERLEETYYADSLPELQFPHPNDVFSVVVGAGLEEISGVSRANCAELLAQAFLSRDVAGSLRLLDDYGIIEDFIPELRGNRNLDQDERWNGQITVGEHAFQAAGLVTDFLNSDQYLGISSAIHEGEVFVHPSGMSSADVNPLEHRLSEERFRILVGLVAFCHDLGKRAGRRDLDSRGVQMKRGEQDVKQIGLGTSFRVVIFEGHEKQGAQVFLKNMEVLNRYLPAKWRFSPIEIQMAGDWIEHHNQWKQMVRNSPRSTPPEQHAFRMYSHAYPDSRFHAELAPDQAVWGLLLMSQMELLTSEPNQHVESAPQKNWDHYQKQFEQNRAAFQPIVPATLENIGTLRSALAHRLQVPLVGGNDWYELDIPETKIRTDLRREIANRQEGGEITTRLQALRFVSQRSHRHISEDQLRVIAEASGGYSLTSGRLENLKLVNTTPCEGYTVREWEAQPFPQRLSREQAALFLESGNFPRILAWARDSEIRRPHVAVEELLRRKKGFANILQLEAFLSFSELDPRDLRDLYAPNMTMFEVLSDLPSGEQRRIALPFGFQGKDEKAGQGIMHLLFRRTESLNKHFRRTEEGEPEMRRRFLWDAVIRVAGTGELTLPSNLYDDRKLLYGQISGVESQYLSLVVDYRHGAQRVMTALYHKSQAALRDDLKYQIRMRAENSKAGAAEMKARSNSYLRGIGASPVYTERHF